MRMAKVATIYKKVTTTPAVRMARGTVRRASRISSPIVDPLSTPPKAKAIVDQKITSLRLVLGVTVSTVIGVAAPKRIHDTTPIAISSSAAAQPVTAPRLFSHLPTSRPTTFIVTVMIRPIIAKVMKYALLAERLCHDAPPMNSAFAAAKYSRPGRYGRFDPQ